MLNGERWRSALDNHDNATIGLTFDEINYQLVTMTTLMSMVQAVEDEEAANAPEYAQLFLLAVIIVASGTVFFLSRRPSRDAAS